MITKDLRKRSRDQWMHTGDIPSINDVKLGCLLRIADGVEALVPAVEKAATKIDELQRENERLRHNYNAEALHGRQVGGLLVRERHRSAALAGHLRRAKAAPNVVVAYRGPFPEITMDDNGNDRLFERGKPALIYVRCGQDLPESFEILIDNRKPKTTRARKAV